MKSLLGIFIFFITHPVMAEWDAHGYYSDDVTPGSIWKPILLFAAIFWFYAKRKK